MARIRKRSQNANQNNVEGFEIWCPSRGRWLMATPEERVRQWLIEYLVNQGVPLTLIGVEVCLPTATRALRADIVVWNKAGKPLVLVECKAPHVALDNNVFMQVAQYNMELRVPFLVVSNGVRMICAKVDLEAGQWEFLPDGIAQVCAHVEHSKLEQQ